MENKRTSRIPVKLLILVLAIAFGGVVFVKYQISNKRSLIRRMVRSSTGEYYVEQRANDLAVSLRRNPALAQLQPWAVATIERVRSGQVETTTGTGPFWAPDAVTLASAAVPEFIKTNLEETNSLGVWPLISIVLSDSSPSYIVLDFGGWGVVVGSPKYRISFGPQWAREIKPGVYTYALEK